MIPQCSFLIISLLLLSSGVIPATASGQEARRTQAGWRATVECDSLVVYSQMSIQSKVVGHFKKGDTVTITLEFISAGGAWCSVAEPGKWVRLGYVDSECLGREPTESYTVWQTQSPPSQTRPATEVVPRTDTASQKYPTREEIEREVDRALASRLNALLPANDYSQTAIREPFWFDRFDQTSLAFLPRFGVPFNFFQHIVPRVTSVQIRPSHMLRRR